MKAEQQSDSDQRRASHANYQQMKGYAQKIRHSEDPIIDVLEEVLDQTGGATSCTGSGACNSR